MFNSNHKHNRILHHKPQTLLAACGLAVLAMIGLAHNLKADGGSAANPDLQVGGYTVFGTNTTGATTIQSGWGNVYIDGSLQIRSNLYVNATIVSTNKIEAAEIETETIETERINIKAREQRLLQNDTILPLGSYIRIRGEEEPVSLGTPQIDQGDAGQLITLQGISSNLTVTLTNGKGLRTHYAQPFTLGAFDTIQFVYDHISEKWVEINRSNNRWNF